MVITIHKSGASKSNHLPFADLTSPVKAAKTYAKLGFTPIPIKPGTKEPAVKWKNYCCQPDQFEKDFGGGKGVALRMGHDYGGLVDIDLDSPEARSLAPLFLPDTDCIFGRESSAGGHHVYRIDVSIKSQKFQVILGNNPIVLAEIRGDNHLTTFPPSTHISGEVIRFEQGKAGLPTQVDQMDLRNRVGILAAAALLTRQWPNKNSIRQEMAMALAGGMLQGGMPPEFVEDFIFCVANAAEDEEAKKRVKVVVPTHEKIKAGDKTIGWPTLADLLGQNGKQIVEKCILWLGISHKHSPLKTEYLFTGTLDVVKASEVTIKEVEWFWESRIAYGAITILDGDPERGKSAICLDLAARQSAGLKLPGCKKCDPAGVVVLSCEDNYDTTIVPRLIAANADMDKISLIGNITLPDGSIGLISIPESLGLIQKAIKNTGARLLIIDPLVAFISLTAHTHNDQQVRRALGPLKSLAEETGVAVIAVRHLTKKTGPSAMYRGGGSIGLIGAARTALLVGQDPTDPDYRVLAVTKCNLAKKPPSLRYQLESKTGVTDDGKSWSAPAVKWCGITNVTADQLVSEPKPDKTGALHDAMVFLEELLTDGPKSPKEIFAQAKEEGISKSTLYQGKRKLGIKSTQIHDGKKITGWQWNLPEEQSPEGGNQDDD